MSFFLLDSVNNAKEQKYHLFLTNTSLREVNLPLSALGVDETKKIYLPMENGRRVDMVDSVISSINDNYFCLLPNMAIGIVFENDKSQEIFENNYEQVLKSMGVVLTDDKRIPLKRGDILDILQQSQSEKENASIQDSLTTKENIQKQASSTISSSGLKNVKLEGSFGKK